MAARLAVLFIHGVEINNKGFVDTPSARLKSAFARYTGVDPDDALVIRPAFWAPVIQASQDELLNRLGGRELAGYFRKLNRLATRADEGSVPALLALVASGFIRWLPSARNFHFPSIRWLVVTYIGDVVAYQINSSDRALYDGVHAVVAGTLADLAEEAGEDAPLCVITHSLGAVIASNFFYDLQAAHGYDHPDQRKESIGPRTENRMGSSPLERGETLTFMYTLGSPLALWAGRLPEYGEPVLVPHPRASHHNPAVDGEWVNVYDSDDVIAWPLRGLNPLYDKQVHDREVSLRPRWIAWTPLAHPLYWHDSRVLDPIGRSLARAWLALGSHP